MNVLVVVNRAEAVDPAQTTASLARALAARGHGVWYAGVAELGLDPDDVPTARGLPLAGGEAVPLRLPDLDLVLVRTNPARDPARGWAHDAALLLLARARDLGTPVLNDPDGLRRASSKLYQVVLPARHRPRTLVSRDRGALRAFVAEEGRAVLKPLAGTHGRDVFLVEGGGNLNQIIDVVTRDGYAMAQAYVPEAVDGDVRVLLLDGRLLTVGGRTAVVRRRPGGGDFRSNVSAGGHAEAAVLTPAIEEIVADLGPGLRRDGLVLTGLDVIGDKVVEINVFAPGGLADAGAWAGVDFHGAVVDRLEAAGRR